MDDLIACPPASRLVLLSDVRSRSGQPCSPSRAADFCVLRPARHTLVCLRGRVLHKSSRPRRFRPASAPIVTALATLVEFGAARGIPRGPAFLVVAHSRRRPAPAYSARHLRRDASSAGYRLPSLARHLAAQSANRSAPSRSAPPRQPSHASVAFTFSFG